MKTVKYNLISFFILNLKEVEWVDHRQAKIQELDSVENVYSFLEKYKNIFSREFVRMQERINSHILLK